ncbi:hypothetical protein KDH_72630 [Dictyobacter sp. S3.2.2.5]|uniref:Uncharacterized protein n=1 Tax=Dictyobacter halimunensis TaxID=3026934 RepID=A0ABQ6G1Q0_9CHLR|nr:hypothetical protein KDH_72630 [Dictyobacter sp. S3.2.2.5]
MRKLHLLIAALMLSLMASIVALPSNAMAHSVQMARSHTNPKSPEHSDLPRLFFNVGNQNITFTAPNTPVTVVRVPNVRRGFYEVSFNGSIQFPNLANDGSATQASDTVTCNITVAGIVQRGFTIARENTGFEEAVNEVIPFGVTSVVFVPFGATVAGTCRDTAPMPPGSTTATTILAGAQIALIQGRVNEDD